MGKIVKLKIIKLKKKVIYKQISLKEILYICKSMWTPTRFIKCDSLKTKTSFNLLL